ncbi:hypothetical protein X727_24005 [Mesorhizobium sp. L103C119B0]|nr:hypothetical protein X727_24005 [Mesorhizobium sp. L103C119B0]
MNFWRGEIMIVARAGMIKLTNAPYEEEQHHFGLASSWMVQDQTKP